MGSQEREVWDDTGFRRGWVVNGVVMKKGVWWGGRRGGVEWSGVGRKERVGVWRWEK